MLGCQVPRRRLQGRRAEIVGRRIDQVSGEEHPVDDPTHTLRVGAFRQRETQRAPRPLAVAGEHVAAESDPDGGFVRPRDGGRQMPAALGQMPSQRSKGKRRERIGAAPIPIKAPAIFPPDPGRSRTRSDWP